MPGLGAALKRRLTRVCERLFYCARCALCSKFSCRRVLSNKNYFRQKKPLSRTIASRDPTPDARVSTECKDALNKAEFHRRRRRSMFQLKNVKG